MIENIFKFNFLKVNTSEKDAEDLLKELDIMLQLGTHPNVVRLLGCCTENGIKLKSFKFSITQQILRMYFEIFDISLEPYFLIMEYVSNGKLLSYLRSHRTDRTYYNNNDNYSSKIEGFKKTLSSADLVSFAYQIAKGMEFISSHGV